MNQGRSSVGIELMRAAEFSLRRQRRLITGVSTVLIFCASLVFVLVSSRKLCTSAESESLEWSDRLMSAMSPVVGAQSVALAVPDNHDEMLVANDFSYRIHNWLKTQYGSGRWYIMTSPSLIQSRDTPKRAHRRHLMFGDMPIPQKAAQAADEQLYAFGEYGTAQSWLPAEEGEEELTGEAAEEYGESSTGGEAGRSAYSSANRASEAGKEFYRGPLSMLDLDKPRDELEEKLFGLFKRNPDWERFAMVEYNEANAYRNFWRCENVVLMSVNPLTASHSEARVLRYNLKWNDYAPNECVLNIFGMHYEATEKQLQLDRYDAVLRAMHLVASRTVNYTEEVPWIFSVSAKTLLTSKSSVKDLVHHVRGGVEGPPPVAGAGATAAGATATAAGRRLHLAEGAFGFVSQLIGNVFSYNPPDTDAAEAGRTWHTEGGHGTIERLMCGGEEAGTLSCAGVGVTPPFSRFAFFAATTPNCDLRYSAPLATAAQLYRPSPLGALVAASTRRFLSMRENETGDGAALSRILAVMAGLSSEDVHTICGSRLDGWKGQRRWADACGAFRRLVFARTVDPRRFSGAAEIDALYSFDDELDGGRPEARVFVHPTGSRKPAQSFRLAADALQVEANRWLTATSDNAMRFFGGEPAASDWTLEGPGSLGFACPSWFASEPCSNQTDVVARQTSWACGDRALTHGHCPGTFPESFLRRSSCQDGSLPTYLVIDQA